MPDIAFDLPARPADLADAPVAAWYAPVVIPSYLPEPPDRYPAYLDQRVYQGSSGAVYPLPFHDRISQTRTRQSWQALHLENAFLRVMVLPQLGGRIHLALDRRNGYPIFYANPVIKPALVGLAGPWIAGGVEFNWPQHHRPATFLPSVWDIEQRDEHATVWCSDHDPFARMKGMHGVRLSTGSTVIELRVRLFNRSDEPQTFLWWANVAAETSADYQSFFPADVQLVADHAKRALSTFPAARGRYYGVDYPARRDLDTAPESQITVPGDRLDWYRNIPVPTSYMCLDSEGDFFGGYDHRARAGFVHWADHHYAVGKKQWTWGNAEFGRAWNRNLADDDSTYIELMAGVFTDNQPDFSHLAPGETKAFSQFWYPIAETGPVSEATCHAALGAHSDGSRTTLIVDATHTMRGATVTVRGSDHELWRGTVDLAPDRRWTHQLAGGRDPQLTIEHGGQTVLRWSSAGRQAADGAEEHAGVAQPAFEPDLPSDVASVEELYLIGRHLEQYRHATRSPEPYWREALRRDPGHAGAHIGLAGRAYRDARFAVAEEHLRAAISRLTTLNPNPTDGSAHYLLGLTLVRLGRDEEAYAAFAKASWLRAWTAPGCYQLAVIDARRGRNAEALARVEAALRAEPEHLQARDLRAVLLGRLKRPEEARTQLADTLALDPLDLMALDLTRGREAERGAAEAQLVLDVALEYARIGEFDAGLRLLGEAQQRDRVRPLGQTACGVIAGYCAAVILERLGHGEAAVAERRAARGGDRTWNFPSRLDEVQALEQALAADPTDATAGALLGHWLYAHHRTADALAAWGRSAEHDAGDPVVWRNLAVAAFNTGRDIDTATRAYDRALELAPGDARLWFESDQLLKRVGTAVETRLSRLESAGPVLSARDDLCVEYAQLLVSVGRAEDALTVLTSRTFQPWEGGEGQVLRAWERTRLALARTAAAAGDASAALAHVEAAIETPASLGEARHPLANPARLLLELGAAAWLAGDPGRAQQCWRDAADAVGDFAEMATQPYSDQTFYSVLAARRVGDSRLAGILVDGLSAHVAELASTPARIDYFATSLPTLLLFHDDPQRRRDELVDLLRAQLAVLGGDRAGAEENLARVLVADPGHELALDLRRRVDDPDATLTAAVGPTAVSPTALTPDPGMR